MRRRLTSLVCSLLLILAAAAGESAQSTPVVLYTDLQSGPNSGGENNNGTYLSIFGKNFGSLSGLGTITRVFIGGAEVASYRYLRRPRGVQTSSSSPCKSALWETLLGELHCRSRYESAI